MIGRVLIFVCSLCAALPAAAQVVQLRSGDHETFSRLVVEMPSRLDWSIEPGENRATVKFDASNLQIDTSVVFDKISRDRVSTVTWNETSKSLQIGFGCDCEISGFWHGSSLLVLDVQQRPISADPVVQSPPAPVKEANLTIESRAMSQAAELATTELLGPRLAPTSELLASKIPDDKITPLDETRDRLLQQFARAATQGLIEPRPSLPDRTQRPKRAAPSPEMKLPEPADVDRPQINLKAESSIDRDFLGINLANSADGGTNGCLPLEQVDVASWGSDAPFGQQVSALRLELTGEFDEIDLKTALKLARLYLFFGFGAEARQILALRPSTSMDAAVVLQLADIAEHGHAQNAFYLTNQMDCASPAALWSALSYETLPRDLPMDAEAILRAFNALPLHLRTHYGPILSRRFLKSGQEDTAKKILRILDRPDAPSTPMAEMAKAHVDISVGQVEEADARLEQVVESNAEPSAEALVNMINDRVSRDHPLSIEQAQLAAAYAFEKQNDPIGAELSAAHIRALASAGSFDMAYETLADRGDAIRSDQMPALHSDLLRLLTNHANDITFLRHMFARRADPEARVDPFAANQAAGRLIELGFPESAATFISQDAVRSSSAFRERRLLRAELALKMNRPRQAIVDLLGMDGTDVNELRAMALSAAGDHAAAYHLFASSNNQGQARREAWLKGDWQNAVDPDEPAYTELAAMMETEENSINASSSENQPVLAQNRELIDASAANRATLSALLAANPTPVETAIDP